jgi:hypothetical protein
VKESRSPFVWGTQLHFLSLSLADSWSDDHEAKLRHNVPLGTQSATMLRYNRQEANVDTEMEFDLLIHS